MTNGISFDDDNNAQQPAAGAARTEQPRTEQRRPQREERPETNSLRTMGRSLGRALSRTTAGEALTKAYNAFDNLFKDANSNTGNSGDVIRLEGYKVTPLDNVEHRVDMSSLVFSHEVPADGGKTHVFYFTLLIEGSTPGLAPVRCEERGRPFEIPRTAGDVYNERYADRVFDLVTKQHGEGAIYHDCGSNVMPASVDVEKDPQSVRNLAFYLNAAVETVSVEILGYQPQFTLAWLERDDSLEVSVDWSGEQRLSAAGQPKRTDVAINITSNVRDSEGTFRDKLSRVGGSLELIYSPAQTGGNGGFGARRDVEETEIVTPLFTITDLDTEFKAITLEMLLLGMASTATLSDDLFWVNSFRPRDTRGDKDDFDPRDIGALNFLVPGGKYFDIKSSSVGTAEFLEYFGTLCRRDLAYAMDIEERGDNTWITSVFAEAAQGNDAALNRIFDACDQLTDGHFTSIYRDMVDDARCPNNPFEDSGNRIILGWYKEHRDGQKLDLRNLDLLYWLNRRGAQDQGDFALDWQDTFDSRDAEDVRIEKRLRMIEDVFGASAFEVTGYARQVMINSVFVAALAAAVKACDIRIDQANIANTYGNARVRGNFAIGRLAGSNLGGGLFGRNTRREEGRRGGGRFYTGRGR